MNTSLMSRDFIAPSLRLHSGNMQTSSVKPYIEGTNYMSHHSSEPTSMEYRRRQEIGVAIICALSREADAVEVLCDKIYDIHAYGKAPGDANIYNVVQMGRHKVVILYLPAMGKSNAATSATNCLHSFPNIRLALLTGICGGIPSPYTNAEILLGDVIVSDRLVLYDLGRRFPEGFTRKDTVSDNARKPLPGIAAFLSKLQTRIGNDKLSTRMANHLNWLRTESQHGQWANYPGISNDVFFESTYHHKHQNGECEECSTSARSACAEAREVHCAILGCDGQRSISRKRHKDTLHHPKSIRLVDPVVHFGAYASGDIVMKSGEDRDEIGRREKVIAFEMEAAGIWDNGQ
jgi:nucleoside phosphorylase